MAGEGCQLVRTLAERSNLRVEVEERLEALPELLLDLLARALQHVHGDVGFVPVGELEGGIVISVTSPSGSSRIP